MVVCFPIQTHLGGLWFGGFLMRNKTATNSVFAQARPFCGSELVRKLRDGGCAAGSGS